MMGITDELREWAEQHKGWHLFDTQLNAIAEYAAKLRLAGSDAERGISSELMYDVCQAWCKVLENGLEDFDEYGWYGKPLFKAIAHKYGWELPDEYEAYY